MTRRTRGRDKPPAAAKPNAPRKKWRKRWWALVGLAVLVVGAAGIGWWFRPATAPPVPPMPHDISDAEVLQAVKRARKDVLGNPESAAAWGQLGMTFLANDCAKEAERCFQEAARLDPSEPMWPYYRAMNVLERDLDQAITFLRQAEQATKDKPLYRSQVRLRLAETLLEKDELDEAERLFLAELQAVPDDPLASFGLGLIAQRRGDDKVAAKYLTVAALPQSLARKRATTMLAFLARSGGDDAAATRYEQALLSMPRDPSWDSLMVQVYALQVGQRRRWWYVDHLERKGDFAGAARASLTELKRQPTSDGYIIAGLNLGRIGEYDKALPLLREAVRLEPENANAHFTLAMTLFNRAESESNKAPGSWLAAKWYQEAIPPAKRATELTPGYAQAYLIWGQSLRRLGKPAAAVDPLRTGVTGRPQDFPLQLALGEALLEAEQYTEAQTYLENARQLEPKDKRPIQALARLHTKKNP